MEVTVDRQLCIGAGMCVLTAPAVFDQDEEGKSVVLEVSPATTRHGAVDEAEQLCPAVAIRVTRANP